MHEKVELYFPPTGGGPDQGPNDSGLEHFMGDIPRHIARECAQNSIDAAARTGNGKPVRLEFSISQMSVHDLPGLDHLKKTVIPACRQFYDKDPKARKYCATALAVLTDNRIPVLRIADYETTGLKGADNDRTGQWYSLVKSSGVSSKGGDAAGSFGIGKHAPFAASAVRAVYYRTRTETGDVAFQGVTKWWSHEDHSGRITQGTGFIGILDQKSMLCRAVRNESDIPRNFPRSEAGTDIWIPGFAASESWEEEIVRHLLANFWLAVHQGDIEFVVGGRTVSRGNLEALLEEYSKTGDFTALHYYRALTSAESTHVVKEFPFLGSINLYLLASDEDQLPKYVQGMRRTGMVIEERRFNCRRSYAGVLLCRNDEGNAFLRSIEPPRHDKWERERITERGGKGAFDAMWNWVRRNVQDLNPKPTSEAVDVPNLARYLPDFPEKEKAKRDGEPGLESFAVRGVIPVSAVRGVPPTIVGRAGGEDVGEGVKGRKDTKGGGGAGSGGGRDRPGAEVARTVHLRAVRVTDTTYRVFARTDEPTHGRLTLKIVNDDGTYDSAELADIRIDGKSVVRDGNTIRRVGIEKGVPLVMELELASPVPVTLAAVLHAGREDEE